MTWLLDTSTIVDALRRNTAVLTRLGAQSPDDILVSSIAVAELAYGAERSHDPARASVVWREFVAPFAVLPFDREAAEAHGRLRFALRAHPIGERDLLIAAMAHTRSLTLVTGNTREFGRVPGLDVEHWGV